MPPAAGHSFAAHAYTLPILRGCGFAATEQAYDEPFGKIMSPNFGGVWAQSVLDWPKLMCSNPGCCHQGHSEIIVVNIVPHSSVRSNGCRSLDLKGHLRPCQLECFGFRSRVRRISAFARKPIGALPLRP